MRYEQVIELMQEPTCQWCGVGLDRDERSWVSVEDDDFLCREAPDEGPHSPLLTEGDMEWVICDRCHGEGTLGGYPGVYTQDDFADDPDFYEDYMNHRRPCEDCMGSGKVKELTVEARERPEVQEWLRDWHDTEAIYEMERRSGA